MTKLIKIIIPFVLITLILNSFGFAFADSDSWNCPSCNASASGNFCNNCGQKKPESASVVSTSNGECHLTIKINFEENLAFSRYDVVMALNGEKIKTMKHGDDYTYETNVAAGNYTLTFNKDGDSSIKGMASISVSSDTTFSCSIHCKNNKIVVDNIKTSSGTGDGRLRKGETGILDNVSITLTSFKESNGSYWSSPDSGKIYVICDFEISNDSNDEISISTALSFDAYADDYTIDFDFGALMACDDSLDITIAAGKKAKGQMGFEVSKDWKELEIHYRNSLWSSKELVFVISK